MTGQATSVPSMAAVNSAAVVPANDHVLAVVGGNTGLLPISWIQGVNAAANTPANSTVYGSLNPPYPAWTDGSYLYVVTAPGTTKRVVLSSF